MFYHQILLSAIRCHFQSLDNIFCHQMSFSVIKCFFSVFRYDFLSYNLIFYHHIQMLFSVIRSNFLPPSSFSVIRCNFLSSVFIFWYQMSFSVIRCYLSVIIYNFLSSDVIFCHHMSFSVIRCHFLPSNGISCHQI